MRLNLVFIKEIIALDNTHLVPCCHDLMFIGDFTRKHVSRVYCSCA